MFVYHNFIIKVSILLLLIPHDTTLEIWKLLVFISVKNIVISNSSSCPVTIHENGSKKAKTSVAEFQINIYQTVVRLLEMYLVRLGIVSGYWPSPESSWWTRAVVILSPTIHCIAPPSRRYEEGLEEGRYLDPWSKSPSTALTTSVGGHLRQPICFRQTRWNLNVIPSSVIDAGPDKKMERPFALFKH